MFQLYIAYTWRFYWLQYNTFEHRTVTYRDAWWICTTAKSQGSYFFCRKKFFGSKNHFVRTDMLARHGKVSVGQIVWRKYLYRVLGSITMIFVPHTYKALHEMSKLHSSIYGYWISLTKKYFFLTKIGRFLVQERFFCRKDFFSDQKIIFDNKTSDEKICYFFLQNQSFSWQEEFIPKVNQQFNNCHFHSYTIIYHVCVCFSDQYFSDQVSSN